MPRGRLIRACCTWSLLTLILATIALWLLTGWYRLFFYGPAPGSYIDGKLEAGRLEAVIIYPVESSLIRPSFGAMARPEPSYQQAVDELHGGARATTTRFYWWGRWWVTERRKASLTQTYMTAYIEAPLWPLTAALVALAAIPPALRRHRRRAGRCTTCGYDRHGLTPDAPCPECGSGHHRLQSSDPPSTARAACDA